MAGNSKNLGRILKSTETKRLFFAAEVAAPWPKELPHGRHLRESDRHLTLAFLGNVPYQKVIDLLPSFPTPPFSIGLGGQFDKCLCLPPKHPHVIAWHVDWLEDPTAFLTYQQQIVDWLTSHALPPLQHAEFLAHVTLCRSPFITEEWKAAFSKLPCHVSNIHLFESMGNSLYESRWQLPIKPPFEEIPHTADLAFRLYGESLQHVYVHAQVALAFHYPPLLQYFSPAFVGDQLDDLIIALNDIVTKADVEGQCPYKAISFHGELVKQESILNWEMIVDV